MTVLTESLIVAKTRINSLHLIQNLNLWGNSLDDISLLKRMNALEVVSLSVNNISGLEVFGHLPKLQELYLRKNQISDPREIRHLTKCRSLKVLWLLENPIADLPNYRQLVVATIPWLQKLDNVEISPAEILAAQNSAPAPLAHSRRTSSSANGNNVVNSNSAEDAEEYYSRQRGAGQQQQYDQMVEDFDNNDFFEESKRPSFNEESSFYPDEYNAYQGEQRREQHRDDYSRNTQYHHQQQHQLQVEEYRGKSANSRISSESKRNTPSSPRNIIKPMEHYYQNTGNGNSPRSIGSNAMPTAPNTSYSNLLQEQGGKQLRSASSKVPNSPNGAQSFQMQSNSSEKAQRKLSFGANNIPISPSSQNNQKSWNSQPEEVAYKIRANSASTKSQSERLAAEQNIRPNTSQHPARQQITSGRPQGAHKRTISNSEKTVQAVSILLETMEVDDLLYLHDRLETILSQRDF